MCWTGTAGVPGTEISGHGYARCSILHRVGVELAEERRVRVCGAWATYARGHARSGISGVSGCGVCCGWAIAAGCDAGAGGGGFGDVLRDRADRGAAGARKFEAARRAGGLVAGGAVPVHGELHGGGAYRNTGDISDGARDSGAVAD